MKPDGSPTIPLAELAPGESGTVASLDDRGPITRRLLDLGFIPKTAVRVLRRAPLADPVIYELRGTQICLRHSEARTIQMRRTHGEPR